MGSIDPQYGATSRFASRTQTVPCGTPLSFRQRTFCIHDAPMPEAIRRTAARSTRPVAAITAVRVLDAYFYK